jgi:hypothetical protein
MDIIIKDVPEGAEEDVKCMALVAIERFLRARDVKVEKAVEDKFQADMDSIRCANNMDTKEDQDGLIETKPE